MILLCSLLAITSGLIVLAIYAKRRDTYQSYRSTVTSKRYTCFDLQTLIAAMQVSKKFEVKYYGNQYDISSESYINDIVYKIVARDGERSILLSKKDYFKFVQWYEKYIEQQKEYDIAHRCTYDVLDDLQKDINIALENAQKSVADAGKKYADIVSKIGM